VAEVCVAEIKISINIADKQDPLGIQFQSLLNQYKEQSQASVTLQVYTWGVAWAEFTRISQYGTGPVVSQIGDSWMGTLMAKNSVRSFKDRELAQLNGQQSFLESSWQSCLSFNNKDVVAIPWILDTYLVYYHRDLLEKAGVDETTAFSTFAMFQETLQKLQASGISHPLAIATNWSHSNIHLLASWVWGNGGEFTNPEGTQVIFNQPETRKGIKMYFDLFRFIQPEMQPLTDQDCLPLFIDRKAAVIIRNSTLSFRLKKQEFPASFSENVGTAVLPGVPWIGGSHLVIWNHIRAEQEQGAINLIKFLTSAQTGLAAFESIGFIPANLDALNQIDSASIFAPAIASVKKGRVFRRLRMWALVEEKLALAMMKIWSTLFSTANPDLDQIIAENLDPMETKINISLSQ
jgi:ABC-type glycerol-3-phosphate transport system substrate-binding protein